MMTATCSEEEVLCVIKYRPKKKRLCPFPGGADQGFHVVEVALQRLAARRGDAVLGLGYAALEEFAARHVRCLLELARMHAEIAVRGLQQRLQLVERERLIDGERADHAEPHALVNETIELIRRGLSVRRFFAGGIGATQRLWFSHRTAAR